MDFVVMSSGVPVTQKDGTCLQVAYLPKNSSFYLRVHNPHTNEHCWVLRQKMDLRTKLRACGLSATVRKGEDLSDVDEAIMHIQDFNSVDYVIPLAGYTEGKIVMGGSVILVDTNTNPTTAKEGNCEDLQTYIRTLVGDEAYPYQLAWWKWARTSIAAGHAVYPGQVLIYIGPSNIGKSFTQKITTSLLGGRSATPLNYMSDRSPFNSDLFKAEHLAIEDPPNEMSHKARRAFGARLKEFTVNQVLSCHGKGLEALNLKPKWRVTLSLNEEAENRQILPPLDDSILDKIMLIRCRKPTVPAGVDFTQAGGFDKWDAIVNEQLPAFAHFVDNFEIPKALEAARFGVKSFHDKTLINEEEEASIESEFWDIIQNDLKVAFPEEKFWEGSSVELERVLLDDGMRLPSLPSTRKLLTWRGACGTYLGRLAKRHETKITKRIKRGTNLWRIELS